jgi:hypothetical protein
MLLDVTSISVAITECVCEKAEMYFYKSKGISRFCDFSGLKISCKQRESA